MKNQNNKIPGGAFIIARKIFKSDIFKDKPAFYFKLWVWMIGKARYVEGKKLNKSWLITTYKEMAKVVSYKAGWRTEKPSKHMIFDFCDFLRKTQRITTMKTTRGILIKVLNYELYQTLKNYEGNNEDNSKETVREHDRKERCKKDSKRTEKIGKTSGIGYLNPLSLLEQKRLSEIFKTSEQTIELESQKCYDWLISKGRSQKNYPAFFRNWIRKAIELNPRLKKPDLESLGYKRYKAKGGGNK